MTQSNITSNTTDTTIWGNVQFLWSEISNQESMLKEAFGTDLISPFRMSTKLMREYGGLTVWCRHIVFLVKYWWVLHVLSKLFLKCQVRYIRRWGKAKNRSSSGLGTVLVPKMFIYKMQEIARTEQLTDEDKASRTCFYTSPDTVHHLHSLSFKLGVVMDCDIKYTCLFVNSMSKRFMCTFMDGRKFNLIVDNIAKRQRQENVPSVLHD